MTDLTFPLLLIVSPFIGSFLGVVIDRNGQETILGRSHCDHCHTPLRPLDLVPIASWLGLGGKCRYCGARLGTFYPLIELAATIPVLWAAAVLQGWLLAASALFGWMLLALSVIDGRQHRLPDSLTFPLLFLGLVFAALFDGPSFVSHLAGAALGFAAFAVVAAVYRVLRKRDGLGLGDAKFLAGLGAWLSWEALPSVILLSSASGVLFVLGRTLLGRSKGDALRLTQIAFGPFLSLGAWIVWLYGPLMLR